MCILPRTKVFCPWRHDHFLRPTAGLHFVFFFYTQTHTYNIYFFFHFVRSLHIFIVYCTGYRTKIVSQTGQIFHKTKIVKTITISFSYTQTARGLQTTRWQILMECSNIVFIFIFSCVSITTMFLNVIQTASLRKLNGSRVGKAPNLKLRKRPFFPLRFVCTYVLHPEYQNLCLFLMLVWSVVDTPVLHSGINEILNYYRNSLTIIIIIIICTFYVILYWKKSDIEVGIILIYCTYQHFIEYKHKSLLYTVSLYIIYFYFIKSIAKMLIKIYYLSYLFTIIKTSINSITNNLKSKLWHE